MAQGIFSTYSQGENRVTSSIMQVLKHLPVNVVEPFLRMFSSDEVEKNPQNFIQFNNQINGQGSIPDAGISANFNFLFETKIKVDSIDSTQLNKHIKYAEASKATLVYLTPDTSRPIALSDNKVVWKSFQDLYDLISELLVDPALILSERDQFLLKNLQILFYESGLLPEVDEVVIVAANTAWPVYKKHGVYICQANRSFRNVNWIGFYAEGEIKPSIARIKNSHKGFEFSDENMCKDTELNKKLNNWLKENSWAKGERLQVFDLSTRDSGQSERLSNPIRNDLKNDSGRTYAFTQGQRYVLLDALKKATKTSDL